MLSVKDYVRSDFAQLETQELVARPVSVLLGVSHEAEAALKHIGIASVFDLGASWVFANATAAATAAKNGTASSRFGRVPNDWLHGHASYSSLEDIGSLSLEKLRGMSAEHAKELEAALDVHTIRDFAHWPPHLFARNLVADTAGGTAIDDPDTVHTEALRPRFGEFPTERVYYTTLTMLQTEPEGQLHDIGHTALSVLAAIENQKGPGKLAVGALLEYSQSWYAQGITLGHLLHSLALAPGEATRVAVVDWSRRSRASDTEAVDSRRASTTRWTTDARSARCRARSPMR